MPPEMPAYLSFVSPSIRFSPPHYSYPSKINQPLYHKNKREANKMKFTAMKVIPILVFILSGISIFRFLKISVLTTFSSLPAASVPPNLQDKCSSSSPTCGNPLSQAPEPSPSGPVPSPVSSIFTKKELKLLSSVVSNKAPCNLLVFGLEQEYLNLSSINAAGTTVFLENNPAKLDKMKTSSNNTRIYKVEYLTAAKEAFNLLKYARLSPACSLHWGPLKKSKCKLALRRLPREVYKLNWDVVVVDGPGWDKPDVPGRMAVIYTAGVIARTGKHRTDVLVHDTDRMIEKWFAWEFLCDENLVSAKGKLWHFRIASEPNATTFCPAKTILIE